VLQVQKNQSAQDGLLRFRKELFVDGLFTYHAGCISISPTSAISWMDCEPQFGFTAGGRSYAARRFECRMIPCAELGADHSPHPEKRQSQYRYGVFSVAHPPSNEAISGRSQSSTQPIQGYKIDSNDVVIGPDVVSFI
jgi:hypothetical protein